ncbi:hypothetical protein BC952_2296 [Flavobacterium limicola]|uniref:Uncharacterized protein n=1 Tax=Flavobacterium limicola TaxID=180441 RepID=A0A495RYP3_9FLAO|nr:hypothetical protein BC952_2296 [Flavobacterium limicola]
MDSLFMYTQKYYQQIENLKSKFKIIFYLWAFNKNKDYGL